MASGKTMTTASLMDENDHEKQEHNLRKQRNVWSFSSGPNILISSTEPLGFQASLHNKWPRLVKRAAFETQQSLVS